MWKKNDPAGAGSFEKPKTVHPPSPPRTAPIGGSLAIKGGLFGEEDLFIEGTIEGNIAVK